MGQGNATRWWMLGCVATGLCAIILVVWTSGVLDSRRIPGAAHWHEVRALQVVGGASGPLDGGGVRHSLLQSLDRALDGQAQVFGSIAHRAKVKVGERERIANLQFLIGPYLSALGVGLVLGGETFSQPAPIPQRRVLIGERLWRELFDADPDVIGRPLAVGARSMDGTPAIDFTVAGVVDGGFTGLEYAVEEEIWLPFAEWPNILLPEHESEERIGDLLFPSRAGLRLLPGVDPAVVAARVAAVAAGDRELALRDQRLVLAEGFGLHPDQRVLLERQARLFQMAGVMLGAVLVIGYLLWSALQVGRQQRNNAIRAALGERRMRRLWRLFAQQMRVLLPASAVALALAGLAARLFHASDAGEPYRATMVQYFSGPFLAMTAVALMSAVLLLGVLAVLPYGSPTRDLAGAPVERAGQVRQHRGPLYLGLLALVAMAAITLGEQSGLRQLSGRDFGFDPVGLHAIRAQAPQTQAAMMRLLGSRDADTFMNQLRDALAGHDPVQGIAFAAADPFGEPDTAEAGFADRHGGADLVQQVQINAISPDYFELLAMPRLSGSRLEALAPEEVLVNRRFADLYLGGWRQALDARFTLSTVDNMGSGGMVRVAGVVEDAQMASATAVASPVIYQPLRRWSDLRTIVVKAPASVLLDVLQVSERVFAEHERHGWFLAPPESLAGRIHADLRPDRLRAAVIWGLLVVVAVLGAIGLVSAIRQWLAERAVEMAVRQALGANRRQLVTAALGMDWRHGIVLVAAGLIVGVWAVTSANPALAAAGHLASAVLAVLLVAVLVAVGLFWSMRRLRPDVWLPALRNN